jgi:hypothetical protein
LIAFAPSAPLRNLTWVASCSATVSANDFSGALECGEDQRTVMRPATPEGSVQT